MFNGQHTGQHEVVQWSTSDVDLPADADVIWPLPPAPVIIDPDACPRWDAANAHLATLRLQLASEVEQARVGPPSARAQATAAAANLYGPLIGAATIEVAQAFGPAHDADCPGS